MSSFATHTSGAEQGDEGMALDKDGSCLYCPNLPFSQEIIRAYAQIVLWAPTRPETMKAWIMMI